MRDIHSIANLYGNDIALAVLFLRIRLGTAQETELEEFLSNHQTDPEKLIRLLEAHQVESVVYSADGFNHYFPRHDRIIEFKKRVEFRARMNMLVLDEICNLQKEFTQGGFEVVFYKGVFLSKLLFNDFTTRATSDIDVLIHAKDFSSVRNTLLSAGYEEVYYYPKDYPEYYLQLTREATFRKKTTGGRFVYIEIQWAPLPAIFNLPYHHEYFFSNTRSLKIMGEEIKSPGLEQHLVILLIHHGMADLWRNLKHVFDLAMYCHRYKDSIGWDIVEEYIRKEKFVVNAKVGIQLCDILFGVQVPLLSSLPAEDLKSEIVLKSLLQYPLLVKSKKSVSNIRRQLLLTDDRGQKWHLMSGYLRIFLQPSLVDLQNQYFPPALFPLYYITKRFRFLYRKNKLRVYF